jgi:hypothetical protein
VSKSYVPVPVSAARDLAHSFAKDVVVILCYDRKHDLLHTTTYGRDASDKIRAAELGPVLAKAAGGFTPAGQPFEDFRDPALRAERYDELLGASEEVLEGIKNLNRTPRGTARLIAAIENAKAGK